MKNKQFPLPIFSITQHYYYRHEFRHYESMLVPSVNAFRVIDDKQEEAKRNEE